MIERAITWQHALKFSEVAKRIDWQPDRLNAEYLSHTCLLPLTGRLRVRDMRDWINQSVGQDYALSAVFKKVEPNNSQEVQLPHLLRFSFMDMETAMLFKLTWI
jgi:hypothetical protein